jgi:hypothetical protein
MWRSHTGDYQEYGFPLLGVSENARRFERTYSLNLYGQRVGHGTNQQEADGKQTCNTE